MIDADGYICLADFGVSKILAGDEVASTMTGTAEFVAPEMLKRNPSYSFQADLWALGVLAYQMVLGINPFPVQGG